MMKQLKNDSLDLPHSAMLRVFQSKAQTKAYYNKISKVYDLLANHSEAPIRRAGLAKLSARPGERILEIGFGTGHCLVDLANFVGSTGRIHGIDLSDGMLKQTQESLEKEGLTNRIELICGDAVRLPYQSGTMEAIFMSFTLELFDTPDIQNVLHECKRVLASNGRIVVVGMSKEGKEGFMVKAFEWTHHHFPNFIDCRPIYVKKLLKHAGFKIVDAEKKQMWVPVEIVLAAKPNEA